MVREKSLRSVNIKKINVKNNYKKIEKEKKKLKLERLQALVFFFFKLKRLIQNPKTELKKFWVGLDSGTK